MPNHHSLYRKTQGARLICVRSRDLTNMEANSSYGRMILQDAITTDRHEIMTIKVLNATFPNSWANLSANLLNNSLTFKEVGGTNAEITITIPDGSYTIDELMGRIITLMELSNGSSITYSYSYDDINNKIKIWHSSSSNVILYFDAGNSCRRFLGFTAKEVTIGNGGEAESDRGVDVTDTRNSIYIRVPNLTNSNVIESATGRASNVLAQVPVEMSRNSYFIYEPNHPFEMEITNDTITNIVFSITYQEENTPVDFQNCDWEINLEINFYHRPHTFDPISETIHETITKKVSEHQNNNNNNLEKISILREMISKPLEIDESILLV